MTAEADTVRTSWLTRGAVGATLRLGLINLKLLFGKHWWLFLVALLIWPAWLVLRVFMGWNEQPWQADQVQNMALTPPLILLAIYLGMSAFAFEIDERTIEGVFTVSGSRYRPWLVRIATVGVFLLAGMLTGIGAGVGIATGLKAGACLTVEAAKAEVVILIGRHRGMLDLFESVEEAGRTSCRWCMPYEKDLPVFICRGLKRPLSEIWPGLKNYV